MVMSPDIEAQILRYYHAEKWTVGTIAGQLHVHHGVVRRVLAQAGLPRLGSPPRPSQIDAYLPFIRQTLEKFPTLTASRLYAMARERGYRGSPDHFRHLIACHRPRPKAEAYLRLRSLPGEQAQVDWGHFGHLEIGRARRPLMAFGMVLSYSRQIFLRFFPDARMENFLRDYSVPHDYVRRVLTVLADPHEVRIVNGAEVLACHRRSYDRGAQVEDVAHVQALVDDKRAARQHRATDRLAQAAPASQTLLVRAAERGANLGAITVALLRLLERFGAAALQAAILEALARDVPHPNAVRLALERHREQHGDAPPIALVLPAHVQARDAPVQPHALEPYDQLKEPSDD